jgi:hypothetical protein
MSTKTATTLESPRLRQLQDDLANDPERRSELLDAFWACRWFGRPSPAPLCSSTF